MILTMCRVLASRAFDALSRCVRHVVCMQAQWLGSAGRHATIPRSRLKTALGSPMVQLVAAACAGAALAAMAR